MSLKQIKGLVLLIALICAVSCYAQPKSIHYKKENDFFMNVIYNPGFSIYDFLQVGLSSKNTELKELHSYLASNTVKEQCAKLKIDIRETYNKVKACWDVFLEVENTDLSYDGFGKYMTYNRFAPQRCPNPELKHKLSIVPLKLEEY